VNLPLSASTTGIKHSIASVSGVEPHRQIVKHKGSELPQDDSKQVRDMGIHENDILNVSLLKIPITVNTWDGKSIKTFVEPSQKLFDIKKQLEGDSGLPADNQSLRMLGKELLDDNKTAAMHNIVAGAVLDLFPKSIEVDVETPTGETYKILLKPSDDSEDIKRKIEEKTEIAVPRQIVKHRGVILPDKKTVQDMVGIRTGSVLTVEFLKVPIRVNIPDGRQIKTMFDVYEPLSALKVHLEGPSKVPVNKQIISMGGGEDFVGDGKPVHSFGVQSGSILDLEEKDDPIVFVDVKYGTLFGLQREDAIECGVVTPNQGNVLEFQEATTANLAAEKDKMANAMLQSPNLGVKPRVVVEGLEVEDYDVQEAEAVKNKWGVSLKKTAKSKKGTEFLFVDIRTDSVGYLDRDKLMAMKFIKPVGFGKNETLEQAEQDPQRYDKYVHEIRRIFKIVVK